LRVYGLKNCDTCRKARVALASAGHDVIFVDVRETRLAPADLRRFHDAFGAALLNRRSTTWRGLPQTVRDAEPSVLLAAHPAVMKRPVIDDGQALWLGWGPDVRAALLG